MGPESNIELIRALEKQIEEGSGGIIELKRARNSLLNISTRVPPEILGSIFAWIVIREQDDSLFSPTHFTGLENGSHNFLLVCHHWFKVATNTPEVWTYWGNTLEDWSKRCHHLGGAPIDLVLDRWASSTGTFDASLFDALSHRAAQDEIRRVHFAGDESCLLDSILSSLIPDRENPRERRIESIVFQTKSLLAELSSFFACSHLPNLQCLKIAGILEASSYPHTFEALQIPLWDHLKTPQTTRLTALSLYIRRSPLPIATSQLIPVLLSNPNLRELQLSYAALPDDSDKSSTRVPLRHLRLISLGGEHRRVFGMLNRLELSAALDYVDLSVTDFTEEDVLQTLGPYVQDHFRRNIKFQGRLEVTIFYYEFSDGYDKNMCGRLDLKPLPKRTPPSTIFSTTLLGPFPPDPTTKKLTLDLLAFTPREHVVSLELIGLAEVPEDLLVTMPNIETLWLHSVKLSDGFLLPNPEGPHANMKLLPSLRSLRLEYLILEGSNWEPLITYLLHQTSEDQVISLRLSAFSAGFDVPPEVAKEIQGLVETFAYGLKLDATGDLVDQNGDED